MNNRRKIPILLVALAVVSAGCGPMLFGPTQTVGPIETFTPIIVPSSTAGGQAEATLTAGPFALDLTPLPTPTALPTLDLPTQPAFPQDIQVWDGLPTYPAESRPDFYFRLRYDPAAWALTEDAYGQPVLASRQLQGCLLGLAAGRGLPLSGSVDHEVRTVGDVDYQISTVSLNGKAQFVNYSGGDGVIYTGFEVSFADQSEACVTAAEAVLGTLRSVPAMDATPASSH